MSVFSLGFAFSYWQYTILYYRLSFYFLYFCFFGNLQTSVLLWMVGPMVIGPQTTLLNSCNDVWCWYFWCWPAIDRRTTTSRGCRLRQAVPHVMPFGLLFWLFELLMPHAFNSVKISVKNPGSAFIRNILPLKRFTISKHLWNGIDQEIY